MSNKGWVFIAFSIWAGFPVSGQRDGNVSGPSSTAQGSSKIAIGDIVGASYSDGRYFIWATPPGLRSADIFTDEVIQLARLALEVGEVQGAGFSLDFARNGATPFEAADILDPTAFGVMLQSDHPLAVKLRGMTEGESLAKALAVGRAKRDKQLAKRTAVLLNRAMQTDLAPSASRDSLDPVTQSLIDSGKAGRNRIARMVLEDTFKPVLQRDIEQRYVIQYKPTVISAKAARLLSNTRAEAILLAADADLKFLSAGRVGGEFGIGPSQIVLCGEQTRADILRGLPPHQGESVDFFSLGKLVYKPMPDHSGTWMRDAGLIVHAGSVNGGSTPACANRYAANLTAKTPFILDQDNEVSQHVRDLRAWLALYKALIYLSNSAPLSPNRLKSLVANAEKFSNVPPKVMKDKLMLVAGTNAVVLTISGGVVFSNQSAPLPETHIPIPLVIPQAAAYTESGLTVNSVAVGQDDAEFIGQRNLLRIDISSLLSPARQPHIE